MCDSITNGGYMPVITIPSCPPSNVIIASNVLSTTGNVLCANIISGDGTFSGNLFVSGQVYGVITYSVLNVAQVINTGSITSGAYYGNGYGLATLNASNLLGLISDTNLPTTGVAPGLYGSSANVSQVTVDQYGRVTTAANVAILSSQWTTVAGNVAYAAGVSIGTLNAPPVGSNLYVLGTANMTTLNVTSLLGTNTLNVSGISNLNSVVASTYQGDAGFLSNIQIPQPLANLVVSNTVTTNNAAVGNTLTVAGAMTSNAANTTFFYDTFTIPFINTQVINVGAITSLTTANVTTLNVQSLFANSAVIYGANTLNVFGISNLNSVVAQTITGNGSSISSLNSSNLFGTLASTLILGNTLANIQASNIVGLTTVYGNTLSNLNASNLAFGVVPSSLIFGNTLSNIQASNIVQPFTNLVVSNTLTTTNIVAAGFTSNSTNTVFNFDTLTIPFINSSTLNVASASNLQTLTVTGSVAMANSVVIGPTPAVIQANLHVEQGNLFIGNSAAVGTTVNTNSVTQGTLVFDNTANNSIIPNKIILYNNVGSVFCGLGVNFVGATSATLAYYSRSVHQFITGTSTEQMRINSSGGIGMGTNSPQAKLHINGSIIANLCLRVDYSNVAIATTGGGLVGINTLTPSANLHVLGNIYASNALQTTNVYINNGLDVGPGTLGSNIAVFSNASGLSNVVTINSNAWVGIGTTSPSGLLHLYSNTIAPVINIVSQSASGIYPTILFNYYPGTASQATAGIRSIGGTIDLLNGPSLTSMASFQAAGALIYSGQTFYSGTAAATEKMRIGTTGVSISTLANARSNLDVAGNIFASNALSTTNVFASGQVVATGKSGVGVCPPIVYRQGGSATNWNTPGSNTTPNVYAITSGVVQMQCGANVMTSTTQFIPFPVAYTNNPTVLVTSYGTTGNIWVASITSSAFSVSANTAQQFEWLSIGI
jgi:hypothetical protein